MVAACPNVLLLRTLSKGYSLAGLRLGYGLGAEQLVAPMLSKTKDSYNVDAIAQALGTAALDDSRSAAASWEAVRRERSALGQALAAIGFACPASQANFLLATVPAGGRWHSAESVYRALMSTKHLRAMVRRGAAAGQAADQHRHARGKPATPASASAAWRIELEFRTICTASAAIAADRSVRHRRQGCSNALREVGRAIGRLRGLVDQGASPQLLKRQRRVDPARIIEVAVDPDR